MKEEEEKRRKRKKSEGERIEIIVFRKKVLNPVQSSARRHSENPCDDLLLSLLAFFLVGFPR